MDQKNITRREFFKILASITASAMIPMGLSRQVLANTTDKTQSTNIHKKMIPSTGEQIPVIGMGTWLTFDVDDNPKTRENLVQVLNTFFHMGGGLIDSSPMYGTAEAVLGDCFLQINPPSSLFSASKIWTSYADEGHKQFQNSQRLWGLKNFDLFQIHNLLNWPGHLQTLKELKESGIIRYIGITTSHGRRHKDLEKILLTQDIDWVQLTYNVKDRQVEDRLLPIAQERGIAVIANRPYQGGHLIRGLKRKPVPQWAQEAGLLSWSDILLKFIISHPAVTCAIPATSQVIHMKENMQAGYGSLPDGNMRKKIIKQLT